MNRNISRWINTWSQRCPERTALVFGSRRVTYLDLECQITAGSGYLRAQGIKRGDRVAILLGNTPEFVLSIFAVFRLGAIAVLLDLSLKPLELRRRLAIARATAVITDSALAAGIKASKASSPEASNPSLWIDVRSLEGLRPAAPSSALLGASDADAGAVLQFSSGTTGQPKCLSRSQDQILSEFASFCAGADLAENERVLCPVSLSHAHGLCNGMMAALLSGGTLVLVKSLVPHQILKLLAEEQITIMPCVPFLLEILLSTRAKVKLPHGKLKLCISAGAPLRKETFDGVFAKFGVHVRQLYGTTETGAVALNTDSEPLGLWDSVGRSLPSTEVKVLDPEGRCCVAGEEGEVAVKSPHMFKSYDSATIAERSLDGSGFFRTGDLGRLDRSGNLYLVGRMKLLINVAGKKVKPAEVEEVLLRHPKVKEAVVLGVREKVGERATEECVKACLVVRAGCSKLEVHEFCGRYLARYQVPKIIEFLREIPKSATGKVLKSALVEANCAQVAAHDR